MGLINSLLIGSYKSPASNWAFIHSYNTITHQNKSSQKIPTNKIIQLIH